jgi:hypothetical protein
MSKEENHSPGPPAEVVAAPAIPDHALIRVIGRGSYGEVWLALNTILGQYRAVKIVRSDRADSAGAFDREFGGIVCYEPVSRAHPGLVNVLQVGVNEAEGWFYYVMELADDRRGGARFDPAEYTPKTLDSERRARGRLPLTECRELGVRLAGALQHLHGAGLVHRDIKPHNIIFVNGAPKLADIGLVSAAAAARTFLGTEGYVPPEGPGTAGADIYALGKVLYEISTGKDRLDYPELPDDLDAIPERKAWLRFNAIVLRACAAKPEARYRTVADLREDIERNAQGRPPRARWPATPSARAGLVVTAIALLALAVGGYARRARDAGSGVAGIHTVWHTPLGFIRAFAGDLDGDGRLELTVGDGSGIAIYSGDGRRLRFLPNVGEACFVGDLDGDGAAEIFAARRAPEGRAAVKAYNADGDTVRTFAVAGAADSTLTPLAIEDLNGNGRLELVASIFSGFSGGPRGIAIFDAATGEELGREEIGPAVSPATWIGPVFGGTDHRIFIGSAGLANGRVGPDGSRDDESYVWCLDHQAGVVWRRGPFDQGGFFNANLAMPAVRPDLRRYLAVSLCEHGLHDWSGHRGRIEVLDIRDGSSVPELARDLGSPVRVFAVADFKGAEEGGLLIIREDPETRRAELRILDFRPGLPDRRRYDIGNVAHAAAQVADLDGDGRLEIILAAGSEVRILDAELRPLAAWRRAEGKQMPIVRVAVADLGPRDERRLIVVSGDTRQTARVDVLELRLPRPRRK